MKLLNSLFVCCALATLPTSVFAADPPAAGSITIMSPANDAALQSGKGNKLEFNLQLSPNGNHVHIYVDDQQPIVYRDVSRCPCSVTLPQLTAGKHTIAVKEATTSHALTGVEGSVTVTVK